VSVPWGTIFGHISDRLWILNIFKILRAFQILEIYSPKFFIPKIREYFNKKIKKVIKNPLKAEDMMQNNNFIMERLRLQNIMSLNRTISIITMLIYIQSVMFYLFVNVFLRD
jgi:hypothetical protein